MPHRKRGAPCTVRTVRRLKTSHWKLLVQRKNHQGSLYLTGVSCKGTACIITKLFTDSLVHTGAHWHLLSRTVYAMPLLLHLGQPLLTTEPIFG